MQLAKNPDTLIAARLAGNGGKGDWPLLAISAFRCRHHARAQNDLNGRLGSTANQTGMADEAARVSYN